MAEKGGKRSRFGWAFKCKSTGVWRVRITLPNGKKRQYTAGPTRELADQLLSRLEVEMARAEVLGEEVGIVERIRFDDYLPRFFARAETKFTPLTVGVYRSASSILSKQIGRFYLDALTARDARQLQDRLYPSGSRGPRKHATVNRILGVLSTIMREAIHDGHARKNPVKELSLGREHTREFNILGFDARDEFLRKVDPRMRDAADFTLETGLRIGELLRLDAERDVDWSDGPYGSILVREQVKNKRARRVPMTARAAAALRRMMEERTRAGRDRLLPWKTHRENFYKIWSESVDRAGLRGKMRWHDLRHNYAATVAAAGAGLPEIARLLGTTIETAARYADHTRENYRVRVVQRLEDLRKQEGAS